MSVEGSKENSFCFLQMFESILTLFKNLLNYVKLLNKVKKRYFNNTVSNNLRSFTFKPDQILKIAKAYQSN